jgi:hypothetical protein
MNTTTGNTPTCRLWTALLVLLGAMNAAAQGPTRTLAILKVEHVAVKDDASTTCIVVSSDGQYHLEVWPDDTHVYKDRTRVSTGYLPSEILENFQSMLDSDELVRMGDIQDLILNTGKKRSKDLLFTKDGDIVALWIRRSSGPQEVRVSDAENGYAIPRSVRVFVPWLLSLRKLDEKLIKDAEPNGCQSVDAAPDFVPQLKTRQLVTKDVSPGED